MPVCPGCHAEYKVGVRRCKDCDLELVESTPVPNASPDPEGTFELVELATFLTVSEAEMMQELLENNDIETVLRGETDPIGSPGHAEPVTLLVEKHNLESARELYEAFFAGEDVETGQPDQD